jgi:hypothetical protein
MRRGGGGGGVVKSVMDASTGVISVSIAGRQYGKMGHYVNETTNEFQFNRKLQKNTLS